MPKEAHALTGYVTDATAAMLNSDGEGIVELKPERDQQTVVMRVDRRYVANVRAGRSDDGETLVQLILKPNAEVETAIKTPLAEGVLHFNDPALTRLTASATAKVILV